jgi:hypothetical protein
MYVSCMTLGTLSKERAMLDYWNDSTLADASESAIVGRLLSGNYAPIGATNASGVTAMDVVVIPTNTSTPNSFTPTPTGSATPTFTNTPTYTLTPAAGAFLMDAAGNTLSSTGHALNVSDAVDHILWGSYLNTLGIGPSGTPYTQTFTPTVTVTGSATPTFTTTATVTNTPTTKPIAGDNFGVTIWCTPNGSAMVTLGGQYEEHIVDYNSISGIGIGGTNSVTFTWENYSPLTSGYVLAAASSSGIVPGSLYSLLSAPASVLLIHWAAAATPTPGAGGTFTLLNWNIGQTSWNWYYRYFPMQNSYQQAFAMYGWKEEHKKS